MKIVEIYKGFVITQGEVILITRGKDGINNEPEHLKDQFFVYSEKEWSKGNGHRTSEWQSDNIEKVKGYIEIRLEELNS